MKPCSLSLCALLLLPTTALAAEPSTNPFARPARSSDSPAARPATSSGDPFAPPGRAFDSSEAPPASSSSNPFARRGPAREVPAPAGWKVMQARERDFEATLPAEVRRTEASRSTPHGEERSVTYTAKLDEGAWLAVVATRLPDARIAQEQPRELLRAASKEAAERAGLEAFRTYPAGISGPGENGGYNKGLDVSLGNVEGRPMRYVRLYLVGSTLYQLVFEGPRGSSRDTFEALVRHFRLLEH